MAVKAEIGWSAPPAAASDPVNLTFLKSGNWASLQVLPHISGDSAIHSADELLRPEVDFVMEKAHPTLLLIDSV